MGRFSRQSSFFLFFSLLSKTKAEILFTLWGHFYQPFPHKMGTVNCSRKSCEKGRVLEFETKGRKMSWLEKSAGIIMRKIILGNAGVCCKGLGKKHLNQPRARHTAHSPTQTEPPHGCSPCTASAEKPQLKLSSQSWYGRQAWLMGKETRKPDLSEAPWSHFVLPNSRCGSVSAPQQLESLEIQRGVTRCVCYEWEPSPRGPCVWTFVSQLVSLLWEAVKPLGHRMEVRA